MPMKWLVARLISTAHLYRRASVRALWNRILPFGENFTDRWEKAKFLGFGEGASIYDSVVVIGNVAVGEKSWIGPNCILDGSAGLSIGKTCSVSAGCQIYSHDTVEWAISGGVAPYRYAPTVIGDNVYLGPGAIVAGGSRIGDGCVVGALSFIDGELPSHSFAVGAPARIIGRVEVATDGTVKIIRTT
jgi:acetyltransferase-like isoleucine patch superfamily enzyme